MAMPRPERRLGGSSYSESSAINVFSLARRLLSRSGDDGHARAGAKTGGDLVIVRAQ